MVKYIGPRSIAEFIFNSGILILYIVTSGGSRATSKGLKRF